MCLRTSANGSRWVGDGFATHAMTLAIVLRGFLSQKSTTSLNFAFVNRSRSVREPCEDFAIPCERLATVKGLVREWIRKTVANSSHPSEIGA